MTAPQRVQLRRVKGWRLPDGAVSVARPTRFGNPFLLTDLGGQFPSLDERQTAQLAVAHFRDLVRLGSIHLPNWRHFGGERGPVTFTYPDVDDIRSALADRDLACWCALSEPCHADVLLEVANQEAARA